MSDPIPLHAFRSFAIQVAGVLGAIVFVGCSNESAGSDQADAGAGDRAVELSFLADSEPVTKVDDAVDGVFIPPYVDCREPLDDVPGQGPDEQVCTPVAISGATEVGRRFADYADCQVVRTQRPYWSASPAAQPDPNDPRLDDAAYRAELEWVTEQIQATGCTCCHDSSSMHDAPSQWDIAAEGVWLDTLSDVGLALFSGLADSSLLGAYAPEDNNGFAREDTGVPSTDPERMQAFMLAELEARGISRAEAEAVPPFGGPLYTNSVTAPKACAAGEGITPEGEVRWRGPAARYIHVLEEGSANPGVPPNLDRPEGTLWRLDVPPDRPALASGVPYATTPDGSLQAIPERRAAEPLEEGRTYQLYVQRDVAVQLASCLFTFGDEVEEMPDAGPSTDAPAALGEACASDDECAEGADYCALMPGQTEGYCTPTGCLEQPELCPSGWSCFDVSVFGEGLPSICTRQ